MYASKVFVSVLVCALVQLSFGDQPDPTVAPTVHDLFEQTRTAVHDLFNTFSQVVGLPEKNELYDDLQNVTSRMQATIEKVYKELVNQNTTLVDSMLGKLNEVVENLKAKGPDTNQLQENLKKAVDTLVEQSTKVTEDIKNQRGEMEDKIRGILKSAVSKANNITSELQTKVNKLLTEPTPVPTR